ncbi:dTDP-glucose 4,6-dehydratase [Ruminococcaceae bacterium OttesenSCG-928-D13]|nr:dTDP-glucose 4,6-dehydratase [Ruminococcaceae bacterium OttesenSCG-928-D13]
MKNILVTGGAGFIGSNFILYMLEKYGDNIQIVNLDLLTYAGNLENLKAVEGDSRHSFVQGDIGDGPLVAELMEKHAIDTVINFAAESHVDRSIEDPGVFARTNVMGTVNLLSCARAAWENADGSYKAGVKFVQVSTDEVYGSLGETGYFTEETPLSPRSPYSASKASADLFVAAWSDTYGMPVNITRCSNNYGPYQFPEKLIPLMIHNAVGKKDLPVYGDGLNVRDWLYVDDHCKAIALVAEKGCPGEVYNVGGHNERTNIVIVKKIISLVGGKVDATVTESLIKYVTDRKGHDRRYAIDPAKIGAELGWKPDTAFEDGIEKTVDWYLQNGEWLSGVTSGSYRDYYDKMYGNR